MYRIKLKNLNYYRALERKYANLILESTKLIVKHLFLNNLLYIYFVKLHLVLYLIT